MKLSVFYSWQSDRPSKLCRDFIHIALNDAAERLSARRGVEVIVDSDTQGIPGTPPITAVILEKIEACDVFVADMSFVGETFEPAPDAGEKKLLPNPNVMGEFGYALSQKGWRRILLVANEAYGPSKALPFDLGHFRKPATYDVASEKPDAARRKARNGLSARLETNLEAILDDILGRQPAPPDLLPPLHTLAIETLNARFANNPPAIVSEPSAWLCVAPLAALDRPTIDLKAVQAARHRLFPRDEVTPLIGQDHTQWWAKGPPRQVGDKPNPETDWFARLLRPGVVERVFTIGRRVDDDSSILVNGFTLEKQLVTLADRSLALLASVGLGGPAAVVIHLYGIEDLELSGAPGAGRLRMPSLVLPATLVAEDGRAGDALHAAFDALWLAAGVADGSMSYDDAEAWKGYAPDSAY